MKIKLSKALCALLVTAGVALASLAHANDEWASLSLTLGEVLTADWTIKVETSGGTQTPVMEGGDDMLAFKYYRTRIYTDEQQNWELNPVSYLTDNVANGKFVPNTPLHSAKEPTSSKDFYVLDFYVTNKSDIAVQLNAITFDVIVLSSRNLGSYASHNAESGPGLVFRPNALGGGKDVDGGVNKALLYYAATHQGTVEFDSTELAKFESAPNGEGSTVIAPGQTLRISYTQNNMSTTTYYYGMVGGSITYSVVPEPSTGALGLLALAGLAFRRRTSRTVGKNKFQLANPLKHKQ